MGSKGSALDDAVVESFFATLKRELVNRYSWPTKVDLRSAIFEWIEVFYNRQRIHTTLGNYVPEGVRDDLPQSAKGSGLNASRKLSTETGQVHPRRGSLATPSDCRESGTT